MNNFTSKHATDERINAMREWVDSRFVENWTNRFMVTIRANQQSSQIGLSPRESIARDIRFIKRRVNAELFGKNSHKASNAKSIGMIAVTEYARSTGWHSHLIVSMPGNLDQQQVQDLFYKASIQTETFGSAFDFPCAGERQLLSKYKPQNWQKEVQAVSMYSIVATRYVNKKRGKQSEDDYLYQVMTEPNF